MHWPSHATHLHLDGMIAGVRRARQPEQGTSPQQSYVGDVGKVEGDLAWQKTMGKCGYLAGHDTVGGLYIHTP